MQYLMEWNDNSTDQSAAFVRQVRWSDEDGFAPESPFPGVIAHKVS
jgi:hypothetical protein